MPVVGSGAVIQGDTGDGADKKIPATGTRAR